MILIKVSKLKNSYLIIRIIIDHKQIKGIKQLGKQKSIFSKG